MRILPRASFDAPALLTGGDEVGQAPVAPGGARLFATMRTPDGWQVLDDLGGETIATTAI
ncbi:hypothetical protein ACQPZJ_13690 [Actinoplanes sp. CA-054009]